MKQIKSYRFTKKRRNTQMKTIEKMYGKDFGVPNDEKLWKYLEKIGYGSLSQLLKNG